MERNLINLGFGIVVILLLVLTYYSLNSPLRVSVDIGKTMISSGAKVVDVRTDAERSTLGHYPNDVHIPSSDIPMEFPKQFPDKTTWILLYCNTGQRARAAAEKAVALGYLNTRYISGGYWSLLP